MLTQPLKLLVMLVECSVLILLAQVSLFLSHSLDTINRKVADVVSSIDVSSAKKLNDNSKSKDDWFSRHPHNFLSLSKGAVNAAFE